MENGFLPPIGMGRHIFGLPRPKLFDSGLVHAILNDERTIPGHVNLLLRIREELGIHVILAGLSRPVCQICETRTRSVEYAHRLTRKPIMEGGYSGLTGTATRIPKKIHPPFRGPRSPITRLQY